MRILVVDDDPVTRLMLASALGAGGHDVETAADGVEALAVLRREHAPLLITDWLMPELDGLGLIRAIRALESPLAAPGEYTYIIVATVQGDRAHYLEAMHAGADDLLTKPIDIELLGARVTVAERILHLRRRLGALEQLLPVCAWCKRIRDHGNAWKDLEHYLAEEEGRRVSHGICPECLARMEE